MSISVLSELPSQFADHSEQCANYCAQRSLHVRIHTTPEFLQNLSDRVTAVTEQKIPQARLLVMIEAQSLLLRVHHCRLSVEQADTLTCRIVRLPGVRHVYAELKDGTDSVIYAGRLRGTTSARLET